MQNGILYKLSTFRERVGSSTKGVPGPEETLPALANPFVEALVSDEMVGGVIQSGQVLLTTIRLG